MHCTHRPKFSRYFWYCRDFRLAYIFASEGRTRSIWKIRCELKPINKYLSKINRIRVAITDIKELNKLFNSAKYKAKEYLLSFHWTNAYDERVAKKKSVAHCVHTIYDLDGEEVNRLKSWLKIQKRIGIDRVKLYFSRVEDSTIKSKLLQEFGNYLEIVDYRLDFDYICKTPLLHIRSSSIVDNITMNYLYENCLNFYNQYFDGSKDYIFYSNGKLSTNDCLLGFKYEYEFTTNYDIDEIIFPRKYNTNF